LCRCARRRLEPVRRAPVRVPTLAERWAQRQVTATSPSFSKLRQQTRLAPPFRLPHIARPEHNRRPKTPPALRPPACMPGRLIRYRALAPASQHCPRPPPVLPPLTQLLVDRFHAEARWDRTSSPRNGGTPRRFLHPLVVVVLLHCSSQQTTMARIHRPRTSSRSASEAETPLIISPETWRRRHAHLAVGALHVHGALRCLYCTRHMLIAGVVTTAMSSSRMAKGRLLASRRPPA
jgi:hypothetical protein